MELYSGPCGITHYDKNTPKLKEDELYEND
jgi:hypothetical protein